MTLVLVTLCVLVVAVAALVALRMRQAHELALIAAKPAQGIPDASMAKLEERVANLERAQALTAGKKRRA